ncbi:MAG: hypothetical protein IPO78_04135 [Saprospiraceae bacterium]|nr:hypothetical protein [Saprospiraceae bacterium]MBK9223262.1 hypothetical protein [Saprospiraceae bacterium]MBK9720792.1 hypothetical protein [Saprospiraceae bacterium]
MTKTTHRIYISILVSIVIMSFIYLSYLGYSYYLLPLEERFYHPDHAWLKPSGAFGHGLGIIGTLLIIIGVFGYMARKKYKTLAKLGRLKYWLEFHIFLCSLGPVMILFHTAFKFGGIVSVSFWSMVAVVASGVIGRFIYVQIPRSIEGRELSLVEVQAMKTNIGDILRGQYNMDELNCQVILDSTKAPSDPRNGNFFSGIFQKYMQDRKALFNIKQTLKQNELPGPEYKNVVKMIRNEISLNNKITRLQTMQKIFRYWHVAHLPFALVMLIIMIIHVAVTLAFGYRWIF